MESRESAALVKDLTEIGLKWTTHRMYGEHLLTFSPILPNNTCFSRRGGQRQWMLFHRILQTLLESGKGFPPGSWKLTHIPHGQLEIFVSVQGQELRLAEASLVAWLYSLIQINGTTVPAASQCILNL